jgi:hypothetical protein
LRACSLPGLIPTKVWPKLIVGLDAGLRVSVSGKALRDLPRRVGAAPRRVLSEVLAGPVAQPTTRGVRYGRYRTVAFDRCVSTKLRHPTPAGIGPGAGQDARYEWGHRISRRGSSWLVETGARALLDAAFERPATGET